MSLLENVADRAVSRVETKTNLGPDAQVDNKNLIFVPQRPELPGFAGRPAARDRAFGYKLAGQVTIGGRPVSEGQIAWFDPVATGPSGDGDSALGIETGDSDLPAQVLSYSGEPIRQPVTVGGSFVMNTADEIEQAVRDYQNGKFGEVPRVARLR